MGIQHKIITDRIHLLTFDNQEQLAFTFLRFQEYYESPKFRRKIFSFKDFKTWYTRHSPKGKKTGKFTYHLDWHGFNIPSHVLRPFYEGKFNPLSKQERQFLEIFKDEQEPFYVIGVYTATKRLSAILKHEIAHGLFYTSKNYRQEVLAILARFNTEKIKAELRSKAGYHEHVLNDECQAYIIASRRELNTSIPKELPKSLRKVYRKYLKMKYINIHSVLKK